MSAPRARRLRSASGNVDSVTVSPMAHLRVATLSDADALGRLHVAAWRGAYRGLFPDEVLADLSDEHFAATWERRLRQSEGYTLLAEVAGRLIGFADLGQSRDPDRAPDTGELYALYLLPEHWGRGVGYRLWDAGQGWLVGDGFGEATLWVLQGNRRARTFYERIGWRCEPQTVKPVPVGASSLPHLRYRIRLV